MCGTGGRVGLAGGTGAGATGTGNAATGVGGGTAARLGAHAAKMAATVTARRSCRKILIVIAKVESSSREVIAF